VRGEFEIGELVQICGHDGGVIARGLASYSAAELQQIKGLKSSQIEKTLGYCYRDEVVHRSEMTLVEEAKSVVKIGKGGRRG
jgi:glutamate 5-kinase